MSGATKLMTAGGGGVSLTPASSITSDVTVNFPVTNSTLATTVDAGNYYGFKNRIINGGMVIDQRAAGAATTPTSSGYYSCDRWQTYMSQASKYAVQQNAGAVTPPTGFTKYIGITSASAYTVGAGETFSLNQQIEGSNVADLAWGSANAATVTLSFWVRSSLTGTFGGAFRNDNGDRSYPFTYTISSASTWEYKSITVPGCPNGTWLTTNGSGIVIWLGLGVGSTYSGTAGAWASADYRSTTGATSVVGTSGATFYITGVQLEKGSVATSFDYRPYGTELALCQRYFLSYNSRIYSGTGDAGFGVGSTRGDATLHAIMFYYPVQMRSTPTMTQNQCQILDNWNYGLAVTGVGGMQSNVQSGVGYFTTGAGATAYRTAYINNIYPRTDSYVNFSAEL